MVVRVASLRRINGQRWAASVETGHQTVSQTSDQASIPRIDASVLRTELDKPWITDNEPWIEARPSSVVQVTNGSINTRTTHQTVCRNYGQASVPTTAARPNSVVQVFARHKIVDLEGGIDVSSVELICLGAVWE